MFVYSFVLCCVVAVTVAVSNAIIGATYRSSTTRNRKKCTRTHTQQENPMNGINTIAVKNSKMIEDMLVRTSSSACCLHVCVCAFVLLCWSNMLDTREPRNEHKRTLSCPTNGNSNRYRKT